MAAHTIPPPMSFPAGCKVPDKGRFLPVAPGTTRKRLQQGWLCGGACPTLSFLRDVEQSSHQQPPPSLPPSPPHSWPGGSKMRWGCALPAGYC